MSDALLFAAWSIWLLFVTIGLCGVVLIIHISLARRDNGYISYVTMDRIMTGLVYFLGIYAVVGGILIYIYAEQLTPYVAELLINAYAGQGGAYAIELIQNPQ